ncbi:NAD-dependent epimerase/dehydratase family protein [Bauldia litoralis]|uniref:NAD-dependent epimerase/dehydratase family protein n=1 Tax=Bauldia litoralis TaxID=665467 RepID=UPI00326745CC
MTPNTLRPTALVIGATGGIGGEMTLALLRRGWRIRALNRNVTKAAKDHASLGPVEWVAGDAMKPADVIAAADGVSLIVHAANPPGYRDWERLALPMLDSSIAAAEACGARIVFPGTVYNYGPDAFPLLTETSPQNPLTRKGRVRFAMEQRLRDAAGRGVRTLIVRTGDFFGPRAGNNWFAGGMITPGKPVRSVYNPGSPGVGHAWAYLPDVAETMAQLIDREPELAAFETFHFGGHWMEDGADLAEAVVRATGNPRIPIRRFPWWALRLAAPFFTLAWELQEMRYLWKEPVRLDNRKLTAFLGSEPHTPLDTAVSATLEGLGCVPGDGTAKALPAAA